MDHPGDVRFITCAWTECEKHGYELFKAVFHDHSTPCDHPAAKHVNYVFCSERHKQYWVNSHRSMWQLPAGSRHVLG